MQYYRTTKRIGEGAHGYVMKATHIFTGKEVAIKKLLQRSNYHRDNNFLCTIREVETMKQVEHEHIIQLIDILPIPIGIGIVMEYMPMNLNAVIYDTELKFSQSLIKAYLIMILTGLEYMHEKNIMHRDLKPGNLLISDKGILKIADFGLSRVFDQRCRVYSHQVATRWYRAPELLWGAKKYTEAIDLWSVGCVLVEMENRTPLFPGLSDIDQLALVIRTLGTPSLKVWPELEDLPDFGKISFSRRRPMSWRRITPCAPKGFVALARILLQYNPKYRPSASQALTHYYLWTRPLPLAAWEMPTPSAMTKQIKEEPLNSFREMIDKCLSSDEWDS